MAYESRYWRYQERAEAIVRIDDHRRRLHFGPPEISHPFVEEIISSRLAAATCVTVPITVVLLFQIRIRSLWDIHASVFGLLKSLVTASPSSSTLAASVPNLLDICRPKVPGPGIGVGFGNIYFSPLICQGMYNDVRKSKWWIQYGQQTFPSGHTASSFAVAIFLSLYINSKLKLVSDYLPTFWKNVLVVAPILGAALVGGGLIVDHHHHPKDVVGGIIIGTLCALVSYRSYYAAVLDPTFNHIPLAPEPFRSRFNYDSLGEKWLASKDLVVCSWWSKSVEGRPVGPGDQSVRDKALGNKTCDTQHATNNCSSGGD